MTDLDGIVIGGPGHGQRHAPETTGRVLSVPMRLPARSHPEESAIGSLAATATFRHVEYRLHEFHATDGTEKRRWRVWLPEDVKPHMAFQFLIESALVSPSEKGN